MNEMQYAELAYQKVKATINAIDETAVDDIYAISFWKLNDCDDECHPLAIVSYNTETQVKEQLSHASGEGEARWNYAFWLQDELVVLGEDDGFTNCLKSMSLYYSDEELEQAQQSGDNSACAEFDDCGKKIQSTFINCLLHIARKLHNDGVIKNKFSRGIPVIIHELEYYDEPIGWTKAANPEPLIADFLQWYNSFA